MNNSPKKHTLIDAMPKARVQPTVKRARKEGLYDPAKEHDACGLGFIANLKGKKSHQIVLDGIKILENLEHRGATGADPKMGDGAGMLVQIPHEFFAQVCDFDLPAAGNYGLGYFFLPQDADLQSQIKDIIETVALEEGQKVIGWRAVPTDNSMLSTDPEIAASEPFHLQGFFARAEGQSDDEFERRLYTLRRVLSNRIIATLGRRDDVYPVSLS